MQGHDGMNIQPSLPFSGEPVYVATFWAAFALWNGAELILIARRQSASSDTRDRGSFRLLALILGIAFSLDFAFTLLLPSAAIASAARPIFIVGMCCVLAGTVLRWYAVVTLGRYFTVNVATHAAQPVIEFGPYRYIRHPAYAGSLLALVGFALALGNWAGVLAMLILPGSAFGYRIAVEEAALLSELGEPYARYTRRTWRLIPRLI
jgi:protein-S-isoprenylcysteine O-methyltransferase Ste14